MSFLHHRFAEGPAKGYRGVYIPSAVLAGVYKVTILLPDGHEAIVRVIPAGSGSWFLVGELQEDVPLILIESQIAYASFSKATSSGRCTYCDGTWKANLVVDKEREQWNGLIEVVQG